MVEVMVAAYGCGRFIFRNYQMKPDWKYMYHTIRQALLNGTRLNIDCFVIFQKIGKGSH